MLINLTQVETYKSMICKDIILFKEVTYLLVQEMLIKFIPNYYWYEVVGYGIHKIFNLNNIVNPPIYVNTFEDIIKPNNLNKL